VTDGRNCRSYYSALHCKQCGRAVKTTNLLFEPPFTELRGNVWTSSIAWWKARGWLPIRNNWTFFASSYVWDVISRYRSNSALFREGWSIWAQILGGRGRRPLTILGVIKLRCFCYLTIKTAWSSFVWIGYQCVVRMDWRNCCRYYITLHWKQCGRIVKMAKINQEMRNLSSNKKWHLFS